MTRVTVSRLIVAAADAEAGSSAIKSTAIASERAVTRMLRILSDRGG